MKYKLIAIEAVMFLIAISTAVFGILAAVGA